MESIDEKEKLVMKLLEDKKNFQEMAKEAHLYYHRCSLFHLHQNLISLS